MIFPGTVVSVSQGNLINVLFQTQGHFVFNEPWTEKRYVFNYIMELAVAYELILGGTSQQYPVGHTYCMMTGF